MGMNDIPFGLAAAELTEMLNGNPGDMTDSRTSLGWGQISSSHSVNVTIAHFYATWMWVGSLSVFKPTNTSSVEWPFLPK